MKKLETEIAHEFRWQMFNRRWCTIILWGQWVVVLLLLAFAILQVNLGDRIIDFLWTVSAIAILSALNIAIPLLSLTGKFQQRQQVHDSNWRKLDFIKTGLTAGTLNLDNAIKRYKNIATKPTEATIRKTP